MVMVAARMLFWLLLGLQGFLVLHGCGGEEADTARPPATTAAPAADDAEACTYNFQGMLA